LKTAGAFRRRAQRLFLPVRCDDDRARPNRNGYDPHGLSEEAVMPDIKGVAHFSIPVSDVARSVKFYTEIVGCKFLAQRPDQGITFLDAGGVCLLLIKRPAPIAKGPPEMSDGVHHAFMIDAADYQAAVDGLRAKGVEVFFEEDRRGGTIDGPRAYFRDPDGTCLEFINRTAYAGRN
jgi:catechol 2,3-dioxygenase-like lactoylglutathione lyase family enzyme